MESKVCGKCKQSKPVDQFNKATKSKDGLFGRCKECDKKVMAAKQAAPSKSKRHLAVLQTIPGDGAEFNSDGYISVLCYRCKERFTPIHNRIRARLLSRDLGGRACQNNFYCSDHCKDNCEVFGKTYKHIPEASKLFVPKSEQQTARSCQMGTRNALIQAQIDELGHTECEKCKTIGPVELHHTHPVHHFGEKAINSAGHMLLCSACHKAETKYCVSDKINQGE